jgi:uncharacterized repeat protein (TIGR02543 family)
VYTQLVPAEGTIDAVESYKTGYVLEGWYTDSALTQPFDFNTVVTEDMTLYAKWAIADVVSPLFAQLQTGVTAESSSASIRFVAAIDSLEALEVGFVFSLTSDNPTVGGDYCTAFQTNTVWNAINAGGAVVTAEDLHGTYIFGCTITNIPKTRFGSDIYVKGYVKLMDGTYVYTDVKTYSVSGMLG